MTATKAVRAIVILACAAHLLAAAEPALLRLANVTLPKAVVPAANGDVYIFGFLDFTGPRIRRLDAEGRLIASAASCDPVAGGVDSKGNLVVVGSRTGLQSPYAPFGAPCVAKFDSGLTSTTFTTTLGKASAIPFNPFNTTAMNVVAFDAADNIYVAGRTRSKDFPVTPNAIEKAVADESDSAFLVKLSPEGELLHSTLLGNSGPLCSCTPSGSSEARFITVDKAGNITIAGMSNSPLFPVTPGAVSPGCGCSLQSATPFVTHLRPDGSMDWSARLPISETKWSEWFFFPQSVSFDADGSVLLASQGFTATSV